VSTPAYEWRLSASRRRNEVIGILSIPPLLGVMGFFACRVPEGQAPLTARLIVAALVGGAALLILLLLSLTSIVGVRADKSGVVIDTLFGFRRRIDAADVRAVLAPGLAPSIISLRAVRLARPDGRMRVVRFDGLPAPVSEIRGALASLFGSEYEPPDELEQRVITTLERSHAQGAASRSFEFRPVRSPLPFCCITLVLSLVGFGVIYGVTGEFFGPAGDPPFIVQPILLTTLCFTPALPWLQLRRHGGSPLEAIVSPDGLTLTLERRIVVIPAAEIAGVSLSHTRAKNTLVRVFMHSGRPMQLSDAAVRAEPGEFPAELLRRFGCFIGDVAATNRRAICYHEPAAAVKRQ